MTYKVAVTGTGGGSGQGILKALLQSPIPLDIYAIDVQPISAGLFWPGVEHVLLPKPEEDILAWREWVASEQINLIIPGSDRDLAPLAAVAGAWKKLCRIAVSSVQLVTMADDKYLTALAMSDMNLPTPLTYKDDHPELAAWNYPIVVKPRHGAASRGVVVCQDEEELLFHWKRTPSPVAQEYLEGDEYTCALFFDIDGELRAKFVLRRWLRSGDTYRAEVVQNSKINAFLEVLGVRLRQQGFYPFGAINVQLRDVPVQGPTVFEINARCSGTTAIRAHFGYNEPEMLVRHICMREEINQPATSRGFVFRFMEELYLDGVNKDRIIGRDHVQTNRLV